MLAYLLNPSFQCVDVNGKPLTGGYIQSFLTGTTSQAVTYSDFSGTQNASRVTLDAKGMAKIIADSSAALDVYCYNASGVLQWSRLEVTPGSGGGSSQTLIFDPMPTENSFNPVYSNGIFTAIKNETTARAAADAILQSEVNQNASDIADNAAAIANKLSVSDITAVAPIIKAVPSSNKVQISHAISGVAAGTFGEMSDANPDFGGSFKTLQASVDSKGHVTFVAERKVNLPNKSISNFIGGFVGGTLTGTQTKASMSKTSGTLSITSDAVTLPAGTYHVTLKASTSTNSAAANKEQSAITLEAKVSETQFDLFVFKPDVNCDSVQFFTHAFDITLSSEGTLSVWGKYEAESQAQGWDISGNIYIHSVANITGSGGGLSAVVHDATLTGDGTAASPLSVVGGGDSRGIPPTMDSEGYYHIYTLAQMLWVNNSLANLPEKNYKLMNDIVCNSNYSDYLSWETTPPMNEMLATNGGCIQANYFDGNGHTIYGMYSYNGTNDDAAAFFGIFDSRTRPTIKNVRMKNCTAIGNTTAEAIIANGTYSNICVESCLFKNLYKRVWSGSSIIDSPSHYGASIVSNVYSINCTLKGGNAYGHAGLFIGGVASDGGSATSEFFNCYENQTESIVDSFAGSFSYPVNGTNLYKQSGASWNSSGTFNLTDCAEKSTAEMKSQAFCDLLSSNAAASSYPATWSYSDGMFPYLYNWTQE